MSKDLFFSIVIPAHNEEKYIENTLTHLQELEYPAESYEVIVVENGSKDATYEKAQKFASDSVHIFTIPDAGVSKARNFGSQQARKDADWILFLDADTFPDPPFLRSLCNYLKARANFGYVIGTVELRPSPSSVWLDFVFSVTNISLKLVKGVWGGALLVKRPLLDAVTFDETLEYGEDDSLAKKLRVLGGCFFFSTNLVYTSTRRYQNGGWKKIPLWVGIWLFDMMIPLHATFTASFRHRLKHEVIR